MSNILLIEVERSLRDNLMQTLGPRGYEILDAASLGPGLELALSHLPDVPLTIFVRNGIFLNQSATFNFHLPPP